RPSLVPFSMFNFFRIQHIPTNYYEYKNLAFGENLDSRFARNKNLPLARTLIPSELRTSPSARTLILALLEIRIVFKRASTLGE
ncbi:MAG: hypothetical protein AAB685_00670, partial [Patescibacteria group bacterium]